MANIYFFQIKRSTTVKDRDKLNNTPATPPNKKEYLRDIKKGINSSINGGLKLAVIPTKTPLKKLLNLNDLFKQNHAIDSKNI